MHPPVGPRYERLQSQPENPFAKLIPDQSIAVIPSFTLESGVTLYNVPVAYTARGRLSPEGDNAMVICHALSGSADVNDWWGPLLGGSGRAFDLSRFFIVCINSLGSPYGTASPVTGRDGDPTKERYGPEFPLTTVRDDVRLSRMLLDDLGVRQIAAVVGGSMGGMSVLEYAYYGKEYVRCIVAIATSAQHSAWCISWGENQRQTIYSDPKYDDGYYSLEDPPLHGLGAARMAALLTYRSSTSFEARFGRNATDPARRRDTSIPLRPSTPADEHFAIHNEGHRTAGSPRHSLHDTRNGISVVMTDMSNNLENGHSNGTSSESNAIVATATVATPGRFGATHVTTTIGAADRRKHTTPYSAQSYLRYQAEKFTKRFDANCYIAVTRKLDTHDVSDHCQDPDIVDPRERLLAALGMIEQPTLVLGIESDGLFTFAEQQTIAQGIPNSRLEKIDSPEGHDAFLLQFAQVNNYVLDFLNEVLPDIMERDPVNAEEMNLDGASDNGVGVMTKSSTFGEAEVEDITAW